MRGPTNMFQLFIYLFFIYTFYLFNPKHVEFCTNYIQFCWNGNIELYWLLTHSMVQSPSWAANWFAVSQEIPHISRNPKVHYRTHKCPPPVYPGPSQCSPYTHIPQIRPNIIHPSKPRSPQWSPSLQFPHQDPIHSPLLTHARHMHSPSHSSRFYHQHNIGWGVQII